MGDRGNVAWGLWLRGLVGVLCVLLFHTFTNRYVNPLFSAVGAAPVGRVVASVGALAFFLLLLVIAYNHPSRVRVPLITVASLLAYLLGVAAMLWGTRSGSAVILTAGGFVAGFGSAWARVLALILLVGLDDRQCLRCVALAMIVFYAVKAAVFSLSDTMGTLVCFIVALLALVISYPAARRIIEESRPSEAPAVLAIAEPRKFISLGHTFFLTLVAFNIACGFSVTFASVDGVPYSSLFAMVPVIVVALWLLVSGKSHTDTVYVVACLFIVSGLLLILIPAYSRTEMPNTLLAAGINIFKIVLIVSLAAIARRNPANALPVFAWGEFATSLGIWLGDLTGTGVEALWVSASQVGPLVVAGLVLGFVAYNLFALRAFGFERTTGAIEKYVEVRPPVANSQQSIHQGGTTQTRACDAIAARFSLTERERDVLGYLACGRNVPFIEEKLVISRNTVRTHIRHIYQKLDLHSQQELIDFVEEQAAALA